VANWLTREHIPAQRDGQWKAQSVKNLVVRYWRLTGSDFSSRTKGFPRQRTGLDGPQRRALPDALRVSWVVESFSRLWELKLSENRDASFLNSGNDFAQPAKLFIPHHFQVASLRIRPITRSVLTFESIECSKI
jgi:hypothetical protein